MASDATTYIVTGGAGFVGANLVAELRAREPGCHVLVVDDFRSGSFANIVEACERRGLPPFDGWVMPDDVKDLNWHNAVETIHPSAVFHLGAITDTTVTDEARMIRANAESFVDILESCVAGGVPLVYASSAATYGAPEQARAREAFPVEAAGRPNNVYGFSKWLMEVEHRRALALAEAGRDAPPRVVGLRYFNVFGPGESRKGHMASMVYQLASRMLRGEPPRVFTPGDQARDQVYVDDVVDCTIAAAAPAAKPGIYNLGSGRATTFNEIIAALREALDIPESRLPTEYFDMPPAVRAFYQDWTLADMSRTKEGLGWEPRHDPIEAIRLYASILEAGGRPRSPDERTPAPS